MNDENWFQRALQSVKTNGVDTISELARILEEPRESVDRWYSGDGLPQARKLEKILQRLGGDINRALPGYQAPDSHASIIAEAPVSNVYCVNIQGGFQHGQIELCTGPGTVVPSDQEVEVKLMLVGTAVLKSRRSKPPKPYKY